VHEAAFQAKQDRLSTDLSAPVGQLLLFTTIRPETRLTFGSSSSSR
jgi:hypothetical protein